MSAKWLRHQLFTHRAPCKISIKAARKLEAQEPRTTWKELWKELETAGVGTEKTTPPWSPCTITLEDSITVEKACWTLFNICYTFGETCRLLWADETKNELFGKIKKKLKKFGEKMALHFMQRAQHEEKIGGGSTMVWGCLSSTGVGRIQTIEGKMNGSMYRDILEKNLSLSTRAVCKTYCQGDCQLVPKEENKVVGMAQSVTRLKPNNSLWFSPAAPWNLQYLKTVSVCPVIRQATHEYQKSTQKHKKKKKKLDSNSVFSVIKENNRKSSLTCPSDWSLNATCT